jgi:hypothetical protein
MRAATKILLLILSTIALAGCESAHTSRQRPDSPEVVERVRNRVLEQLPTLDTASRDMIKTNAPKIWFSGVPFGGDYMFEWRVASNRLASLDVFNNFDRVESAQVKLHQPAASHY